MKRIGLLFLGVIVPGLLTNLSASTISGMFNLSGLLTATATTNSWQSDISPNAAEMFTTSGSSGSFSGENGQNTIENQNIATEPVGVQFADTPFIVFDVIPGLPELDINFISPGLFGSGECTATPATVGQVCTPANPGGSPFNFQNLGVGASGSPATGSSAAFVFSGVTSDGLSTWQGFFTSPFNTPFQTVLAGFGTPGFSVTNTFSGTIVVTPIPTPESSPALMLGSGFGLLLLSLSLKKRFHSDRAQ